MFLSSGLIATVSEIMRRTNSRHPHPPGGDTLLGDDEALSMAAMDATPRGPDADIIHEKTVTKEQTRINPRTGKPLTMPAPLSLAPQAPSPIVTEPELPPGSQMIREETEEVSWALRIR